MKKKSYFNKIQNIVIIIYLHKIDHRSLSMSKNILNNSLNQSIFLNISRQIKKQTNQKRVKDGKQQFNFIKYFIPLMEVGANLIYFFLNFYRQEIGDKIILKILESLYSFIENNVLLFFITNIFNRKKKY